MSKSASAGRISINLSAGTAQFVVDMDKANAKIREMGSAHAHTVSDVQATSAALRTLEGGVTNNLRAAENFLAKTLQLGGVLKTAFPVVGAIALGGVIFELGKKVAEVIDGMVKLSEAPKRIAQEFTDLTQPIRVANDELAVSNDQLRNDIAKLEGKPQNNLAKALDQAVASSDKLAESLSRAFEQQQKLLEGESVGAIKGFFTNNAPTSDLVDGSKKLRADLTQVTLDTNDKLDGTTDKKQRADIANAATSQRIALVQKYIATLKDLRATAEGVQKQNDAPPGQVVSVISGVAIRGDSRPNGQDQTNRLAQIKGATAEAQQLLNGIRLQQENESLTARKGTLETSASNAKLGAPYNDAVSELQARLSGLQGERNAASTGNPLMEAIAKGAAAATAKVEELNKRLTESHQKTLNPVQVATIGNLERSIALTELQKSSSDKWNATLKEIERGSQEVSDKVAQELRLRDELLGRMDEEIAEAKLLSKAETDGAEAVFQAQLKIKLAKIPDDAVRVKTQALDEAEHAAAIQKTVTELNRETDATNRLKDAVLGGEQARRQAELANIANSGAEPDVVAAQKKAKQAQFDLEDAMNLKNMPASAGVHSFFQDMVDQAQSAAAQTKQILETAFDGVNDSLSRLISGQKVNWGSFFQGLSADFAKMGLKNLESGLAKKFLGGDGTGKDGDQPWSEKVPGSGGIFGKIFGGISGNGKRDGSSQGAALYVQMAAPGESSGVAKGLAGLFGKKGSDDSNDDSSDGGSDALASFTQSISKGFSSGSDDSSDDSDSSGGGGLFSHLFKSLGSIFKKGFGGGGDDSDSGGGGFDFSALFGGFRAAGGDVNPGKAYVVGENGPELFRPPSGGSIVPNHKLGGSTHYYTIDSRGTDPVQSEQRTRAAIVAAHNSAVKTSQQISAEQVKRTPQK